MWIYENRTKVCEAGEEGLKEEITRKISEAEYRGTKGKKKNRRNFLSVPLAFDIETTTINSNYGSPVLQKDGERVRKINIMFVWQLQIGMNLTVIGRTWEEFRETMETISEAVLNHAHSDKDRIVCYVHNLSYEWQYLKTVFRPNQISDVFAMDERSVMKFTALDNIEFRCSYLLCNMGLGKWLSTLGTKTQKKDGEDFDYKKIRYPWTELTEEEYGYCISDVLGLVEAIETVLAGDGDDFGSIPATCTGYVRRDVKKVMANHKLLVSENQTDYHVYKLLEEAFRGGNTHGNRYRLGEIVEDVISVDRSSSYPDVLCNRKFPSSAWEEIQQTDIYTIAKFAESGDNAVLMVLEFSEIELKDYATTVPYLSVSKCKCVKDTDEDNGRVLYSRYLETTITEIDLEIIMEQYKWETCTVREAYTSRKKPLPSDFVDLICAYYHGKTALKNIAGKEYEYAKDKEKINSIFGMASQKFIMGDCEFIAPLRNIKDMYTKEGYEAKTGEKVTDKEFELIVDMKSREAYEESVKHAFIWYALGVWTTAYAREALQFGIDAAGEYFLYCDTDSVKMEAKGWENVKDKFEAFNRKCIEDDMKSGSYATDKHGEVHYSGVYEDDGHYTRMAHLGAKRYCYEDSKGLHITVSGVSKKKGAEELGSIENFKDGFTWNSPGKTAAYYHDDYIGYVEIGGGVVEVSSYVVIEDVIYTLKLSEEYKGFQELNYLVSIS